MGCYTDTLKFLDRIGAGDRVKWQSGLKVPMVDRAGHYSVLSLPALPPPFNPGRVVRAQLTIRYGSEADFTGQRTAASMLDEMMPRGTNLHSFQ